MIFQVKRQTFTFGKAAGRPLIIEIGSLRYIRYIHLLLEWTDIAPQS